jgi:hypothetical protein
MGMWLYRQQLVGNQNANQYGEMLLGFPVTGDFSAEMYSRPRYRVRGHPIDRLVYGSIADMVVSLKTLRWAVTALIIASMPATGIAVTYSHSNPKLAKAIHDLNR